MNVGGAIGTGLGLFLGYLLALWDYRRDRIRMEVQTEFWRERAIRLQRQLNCR